MKRERIMDSFRMLARSQGFYCGLIRDILENEEWGEEFLSHLESQNFKDILDLILYIEG